MSLLKVLCIFLFTLVYLDIYIASAGESQSVTNGKNKIIRLKLYHVEVIPIMLLAHF